MNTRARRRAAEAVPLPVPVPVPVDEQKVVYTVEEVVEDLHPDWLQADIQDEEGLDHDDEEEAALGKDPVLHIPFYYKVDDDDDDNDTYEFFIIWEGDPPTFTIQQFSDPTEIEEYKQNSKLIRPTTVVALTDMMTTMLNKAGIYEYTESTTKLSIPKSYKKYNLDFTGLRPMWLFLKRLSNSNTATNVEQFLQEFPNMVITLPPWQHQYRTGGVAEKRRIWWNYKQGEWPNIQPQFEEIERISIHPEWWDFNEWNKRVLPLQTSSLSSCLFTLDLEWHNQTCEHISELCCMSMDTTRIYHAHVAYPYKLHKEWHKRAYDSAADVKPEYTETGQFVAYPLSTAKEIGPMLSEWLQFLPEGAVIFTKGSTDVHSILRTIQKVLIDPEWKEYLLYTEWLRKGIRFCDADRLIRECGKQLNYEPLAKPMRRTLGGWFKLFFQDHAMMMVNISESDRQYMNDHVWYNDDDVELDEYIANRTETKYCIAQLPEPNRIEWETRAPYNPLYHTARTDTITLHIILVTCMLLVQHATHIHWNNDIENAIRTICTNIIQAVKGFRDGLIPILHSVVATFLYHSDIVTECSKGIHQFMKTDEQAWKKKKEKNDDNNIATLELTRQVNEAKGDNINKAIMTRKQMITMYRKLAEQYNPQQMGDLTITKEVLSRFPRLLHTDQPVLYFKNSGKKRGLLTYFRLHCIHCGLVTNKNDKRAPQSQYTITLEDTWQPQPDEVFLFCKQCTRYEDEPIITNDKRCHHPNQLQRVQDIFVSQPQSQTSGTSHQDDDDDLDLLMLYLLL